MKRKPAPNGRQPLAEADAAKALAEARKLREQSCMEEIKALLEKHNCQFMIGLQVGQQQVPLGAIVALPGIVQIVSK